MRKVSVVVPCYNEERTIAGLLSALLAQTYPLTDFEVIIADGLSTDGTREVIAQFSRQNPQLNLLVVDNQPRNIPSALNKAIAHAEGGIIIRLDAHAMPAVDYIEKCVLDLESGLGDNVGGLWLIRPPTHEFFARAIALAAAHRLGVGDARYRYSDQAGLVDTVPFGCFYRATLDSVGGYDETLLTNEDYELNTRIRLKGGKIFFDPRIQAIYYSRRTLGELARQYWRYGFWKFRMLTRYPGTIRLRQALPPLFTFGMLLLLLLGFFWRPAGWLFLTLFAVYFLLLLVASIPLALRERYPLLMFGIPLAIMTMHFSWGAGFIYSALSSIFRNR